MCDEMLITRGPGYSSHSHCVLPGDHTYHKDYSGFEWRSESSAASMARAVHLIENGCRACGRLPAECICPSFTPPLPAQDETST